MVGSSLVSFVGTSWPAFPACKDASLLLIFSYNKCCMRFSLATFLMLISMGNQGGLWVLCVCVSPPHPSLPFYSETGGEKLFQFQHAPSSVGFVQWSKPWCLTLCNSLALFPTPWIFLYFVLLVQVLLRFTLLSEAYTSFSSVQSLSHVRLFATPWIAARQASLSITNSQSSLRLTSIESLMPSSHLILCHPLLFLPPIPLSIRVFSNESTLRMRLPKL